ncbi:alpha/beta fold hydrolase [Phyllobacterium myrsinacearum]|uniref:Pimeloyl-ACP methyl ester carboxylesterase n=1 Tax=Phyllobacterium myrsinacearum TaxID=28101 RepID=A0A839ENS5_9HYPH|nr:alpha/beta hydrolase [Phyllobacterium myrsinacearum]MBA8879056.1 pimeloyl-ACP methyl ester carboxylesterase [Phyllobacterium myrsinacearum]
MLKTLARLLLAVPLLYSMSIFGAAAQSAVQPTYGSELEGFAYPYPIQHFAFVSQGRTLSMAYMDIAPKGPANGRTVVLLHGKNYCGATWEQTIVQLSGNGYRVIAPDQIGFCASTKPDGYQFSFGQLAANTRALLKSLNIEKAIILGHSMGGMLATRFALNYPDTVEKLVLVNPLGLEDWQAEGVPYATVDQLYQNELKTDFNSIKAYQQRYYFHGNWKPDYDRWVSMLAGMYAGPGKAIVAMNQAQTSEMLFTQPVAHEFARLSMPTLLLIGAKDRTAPGANRAPVALAERLGQFEKLSQQAAATIPRAKLVLFPDLGHSPQVEAPQQFHEALLRGLAE